jgi:hypothetical protein
MNERYLKSLCELRRNMTLEQAVREVCRPLATLTSIDITRDGDKSCLCFITLASPAERSAILREVGGFMFAEGVCLRLLLP